MTQVRYTLVWKNHKKGEEKKKIVMKKRIQRRKKTRGECQKKDPRSIVKKGKNKKFRPGFKRKKAQV